MGPLQCNMLEGRDVSTLSAAINEWLKAHPYCSIEHIFQSQSQTSFPTDGKVVVSIWYRDQNKK